MTVGILGTEYTIEERERSKDTRLAENDAYCDDSVKEIVLAKHEPAPDEKQNMSAVRQKVTRHEIVHAFLSESGLDGSSDWAQIEELVDWIAIQGPKIYKAWQEAGAI